MPSSAPPPGRPDPAPRRGMGGLVGLLAVLAFVILAAVIVTRREPDRVTEAPPASPVAPPLATLAPMPSDMPASAPPPSDAVPSDAPPVTDPATTVASAEPGLPGARSGRPGPPSRPSRRAGAAPPPGDTRVAEAEVPAIRRGPGTQPPAGSLPRRFVLGTTSIESLKPVGRDLKGFEPGGVGVKRAPEVNGRVELEMDPPQVRPGVDFTVKVYLANDGDRDIPVQEVKVVTLENGKSASRTTPSRARTVKPKQRALLHEVEGVWRESARSWAMDVVVTSSRQDVYRNSLRWE
jgi:hypothetical protein